MDTNEKRILYKDKKSIHLIRMPWGARKVVRKFDIEQARQIVREERHFFYKHALTEAKKDGIRPDDVVYIILTGKIIEEYPKRDRFLVYGTIFNNIPLHVVCDVSAPGILFIVTVYIPDSSEWINFQIRIRRVRKR